MSPLLDEEYFEFLIKETGWSSAKGTYKAMLETMYKTPFEPVIEDDENRALDGLWFREVYMLEHGFYEASDSVPCSFYELLVGMAYRVSFVIDGDFKETFWQLAHNAGLTDLVDQDGTSEEIEEATSIILERISNRDIGYYGEGGFFPLSSAKEDQRNLPMWNQMSYYVLENYDV